MAGVDDATIDAAAADRTADAGEDAHNPDLDRGPTRVVAKLHTHIGTDAETGNVTADDTVAMTTVPLAEKPALADDAKRAVPATETATAAAAAEAAREMMQSGTSEPWQQATAVGYYATTALG